MPYTLPGEVVTAEKHRRQRGILHEVIEASPERVKPICAHFGTCGGCVWQHIRYEHQLHLKRQSVQERFERHGLGRWVDDWPIEPSSPFHYRNRMDFVWWHDGRFGLRQLGNWRSIVPLSECHLIHPDAMRIALEINRRVHQSGLPFRDSVRHTPGMRYLVLRHGVFTGEWMALLVADDFALPQSLWEGIPELGSVYHLVNRNLENDISDGEPRRLQGAETYRESIAGHEFHVGPRSFFQPNPAMAQRMVETLREWIHPDSGHLLDLYCGIGLFSETLAERFSRVDSVESVDDAIDRARQHTRHEHISYHAADALDWMRRSSACPDVLITDPPRSGMHPNVLKHILQQSIPRIMYVSCNPKVGVGDVASLVGPYTIQRVQLFDQFPQTAHVEMIVDLVRT